MDGWVPGWVRWMGPSDPLWLLIENPSIGGNGLMNLAPTRLWSWLSVTLSLSLSLSLSFSLISFSLSLFLCFKTNQIVWLNPRISRLSAASAFSLSLSLSLSVSVCVCVSLSLSVFNSGRNPIRFLLIPLSSLTNYLTIVVDCCFVCLFVCFGDWAMAALA